MTIAACTNILEIYLSPPITKNLKPFQEIIAQVLSTDLFINCSAVNRSVLSSEKVVDFI